MVATVAAEEPHIAANIPQPRTFTCISWPGSQVTQGAMPRNRISDSLARWRISPIQMKSGSAASVHDAVVCHIDVASDFSIGTVLKKASPIQPTPSSDRAIQTPDPRNANSAMTMVSAICAWSGVK